jgi:hypothetical protein
MADDTTQQSAAAAAPVAADDYRALAAKADGVLVRNGSVWTYPGAPMDRSGTNLRLPLEYVTDETVQAALADGSLSPGVHDASGVIAVRVTAEGMPRAITMAQAGTSEAGTELPPNSRPEHDAARATPEEIEQGKLGPAPGAVPSGATDPNTEAGGRRRGAKATEAPQA